jgi:hypothetical protein
MAQFDINGLIEALEEALEEGAKKVQIAYQPNYPMVGALKATKVVGDIVYLAVSEHNEYLSGEAQNALAEEGWGR